MNNTTRRRGFTIIELLVVISIMAVIATLATGAAIKSIKQNRNKRIDVTAKSLELALMNYRALHGQWPFEIEAMEDDGKLKGQFYWFHGKENYKAFEKILSGIRKKEVLLDVSALLTKANGSRMTVQKALEQNKGNIPIGYADPDSDQLLFFCILYRKDTDSVKVLKRERKHTGERSESQKFDCPEYD